MSIFTMLLLAVAPVAAVPPSDVRCRMPPGWEAVARHEPHYIVFGEQHGTREAPAFVEAVVCALAGRGERVLLAIEHVATDDKALRTAWELPDDRFAAALLRDAWTPTDDGRDSDAMFAMLVRLHHLKARGAAISVTAFSGMRDEAQRKRWASLPAQGPHEAAQAENIRSADAHGRYDRVVVLAGNFHAGRTTIDAGSERFDSMATHLAKRARTISLNARSSGGSSWNCTTKPGTHFTIGKPVPRNAIDCADHTYNGDVDLRRPPFMHIGAFPGEQETSTYDGFFWLGRTSGSAPKRKQ